MAEAEDVSSPDYEKMGPTQILPHLYIGCMKDALSLSTLKVCNTSATTLNKSLFGKLVYHFFRIALICCLLVFYL